MAKFCIKCGGPTPEGVPFCPKCGATIGQAQAAPQPTTPPQQPPVQQQQQPMPPPPPQQYGQTQPYAPMPGKSNKKLIIGILVAVIAIVVVLLLVFFVFGGDEGKFIGTWKVESVDGEKVPESEGYGTTLTFYENNTMKTKTVISSYDGDSVTITWSDWKIEDGKLCGKSQSPGSKYECSKYKFDGDKRLTITQDDYEIVLVKT